MSIVRVAKRTQYVTIDHAVLSDRSLSWEATGLLGYLLSRPDDWQINVRHLASCGKGAGRDKIYRMLKELVAHGYAERVQQRDASGRIIANDFIVYERRMSSATDRPVPSISPLPEKPDPAEPDTANTTLLNNEFNLVMNIPKGERVRKNISSRASDLASSINAPTAAFARFFDRSWADGLVRKKNAATTRASGQEKNENTDAET